DWDLWLGGAAPRPFTAGDEEYKQFILSRGGRGGRAPAPGAPAPGGPPPNAITALGAGGGRGGFGGQQDFGFYLPFNWRGFYDFGSSLIGDWGIHQLGPANLALRLGSPVSVECLKLGEGQSP